MQEYFSLQVKFFARKLKEFGIHPIIGILLLIIAYALSTYILFSKTIYAAPVYMLISLSFVIKLDSIERNNFLKQVFKKKDYYYLRIIENEIVILPFVLGLFFYQEYIYIVLLVVIGCLMAFVSLNWNPSYVLPTPFYKKPYEFIVGLRTWFYLVGLDYFLTIMAVKYDNYNLGIFAIIFLFVLFISSYMKPENEYFVWNYSLNPPGFLMKKILESFLHSSLLLAPVVLLIGLMFPKNMMNTFLFLGLGYVFLSASILAKYASYPLETQLPYMILLILSVFFPPFLLILIPFLYWKATQHLNDYLT